MREWGLSGHRGVRDPPLSRAGGHLLTTARHGSRNFGAGTSGLRGRTQKGRAMNGTRKQARAGLILAAIGLMGLAACTTDPVSSGDIDYEEIRVDAFSHIWLHAKATAEDADGDSLFFDDGMYGMLLIDKSKDKVSSLPAYIVDSTEFLGTQIFYPAKREPENFSCQFRSTGRFMTIEAGEFDPGEIPDGALFANLADTGAGFFVESYMGVFEGEEWRTSFCSYVPGKGFAIPNVWDVGEIIIRY